MDKQEYIKAVMERITIAPEFVLTNYDLTLRSMLCDNDGNQLSDRVTALQTLINQVYDKALVR